MYVIFQNLTSIFF